MIEQMIYNEMVKEKPGLSPAEVYRVKSDLRNLGDDTEGTRVGGSAVGRLGLGVLLWGSWIELGMLGWTWGTGRRRTECWSVFQPGALTKVFQGWRWSRNWDQGGRWPRSCVSPVDSEEISIRLCPALEAPPLCWVKLGEVTFEELLPSTKSWTFYVV